MSINFIIRVRWKAWWKLRIIRQCEYIFCGNNMKIITMSSLNPIFQIALWSTWKTSYGPPEGHDPLTENSCSTTTHILASPHTTRNSSIKKQTVHQLHIYSVHIILRMIITKRFQIISTNYKWLYLWQFGVTMAIKQSYYIVQNKIIILNRRCSLCKFSVTKYQHDK